jgi:hypothetical protein
MQSHVIEADGPEGRFVIRAEPRGVSMWSVMRWNPLPYMIRWLRRDQVWVIRIRPYLDDPLGRPIYEDFVGSKAKVPGAMTSAEERVRGGRVRTRDPS